MVIPVPSRPIAVLQICFSMLITALKVSYHADRLEVQPGCNFSVISQLGNMFLVAKGFYGLNSHPSCSELNTDPKS